MNEGDASIQSVELTVFLWPFILGLEVQSQAAGSRRGRRYDRDKADLHTTRAGCLCVGRLFDVGLHIEYGDSRSISAENRQLIR